MNFAVNFQFVTNNDLNRDGRTLAYELPSKSQIMHAIPGSQLTKSHIEHLDPIGKKLNTFIASVCFNDSVEHHDRSEHSTWSTHCSDRRSNLSNG